MNWGRVQNGNKRIVAYVALGANLGDRAANLRLAIDAMRASKDVVVHRVSHNYETPAVGGPPDSPPFLNAAAEVETTLSAQGLLEILLEIERQMGRVRRERWGPRVIDLDLLLYGDEVSDAADLILPHPRLHERRFVLEPLAEIAPNAIHPLLGKSMRTLLNDVVTPQPT